MIGGDVVERYVDSIKWIRERFSGMDEIANPVMGLSDWDDAVCIDWGGRLVVSCDGPYKKRLVMKSALVHAATDVVVKGARPVFAMDCLIGVREDLEDMVDSLRAQALKMRIPILGGNTRIEDSEPYASISVFGELVLDEPIRDSGARGGDVVALIGEPVWGGQDGRLRIAERMFNAWFEVIGQVDVHAAKDVTKGGIAGVAAELGEKSGKKILLKEDIGFSMTRNLDNFIICISGEDAGIVEEVCGRHEVSFNMIGGVQ